MMRPDGETGMNDTTPLMMATSLKMMSHRTAPNTVLLARGKSAFPDFSIQFWDDVRIELNRLDGIKDE